MLKTSSGGQDGRSGLASLEKRLVGSEPEDSAVPGPVLKAARFMLAGAAVTVLMGLFQVIVLVADRNGLPSVNGKPPSSTQLAVGVIIVLVEYAIMTWVWVLMARLNRSGKTWARIVASVLFALWTFNIYSVVNSLRAGQVITVADIIYIILVVGMWLAGLGATALLWRSESSAYFRARSAIR
jgi:hypothetical protein